MKRVLFPVFVAVFVTILGCGRRGDLVVTRVGDKKITVRDFKRSVAKLPAKYRPSEKGLEAQKEYLSLIIDKELLVLEARERGLDRDETVLAQLEGIKRDLMVDELRRRTLRKARVSNRELKRFFKKYRLGEQVRASHILVRTKAEVEAVLDELRQGRNFEELAKERSIDKFSANRGGDMGYFFRWIQMHPAVEKAFSLEVGEVSEPVKSPEGYHIVKVTEKRRVKFERIKEDLRRRLNSIKGKQIWQNFLQRLKVDRQMKFDAEALGTLLEVETDPDTRLPRLTEEQKQMVLVSFKGGRWTLGDYGEALKEVSPRVRRKLSDSTSVRLFAEWRMIEDIFLPQAALEAGLDRSRSVLSALRRKEEELMVERLREIEVLEKVVVTPEQKREYYNAHLEDYTLPAKAQVIDIHLETPEKADSLLSEIRRGADIRLLAQKHSTLKRPGKLRYEFPVTDDRIARNIFGEEFIKAVFGAEVGKVVGPIKVKRGYSIFKVLSREEPRQQSFEEVEERVSARVKREEQDRLLKEFLESLRRKYSNEVVRYEDVLKLTLEEKNVSEKVL